MISGRLAALLSENGSILILNLVSAQVENSFNANMFGKLLVLDLKKTVFQGRMTSIVIKPSTIPNNSLIIAGCDDGSVRIFDISSRSEVECLEYDPDRQGSNPVKQVALSDDSQYVCAGFGDGSFVRWNLENLYEKKVLQGKHRKIFKSLGE